MVGDGSESNGDDADLGLDNVSPEEAREMLASLVFWPRQPYWTIEEGVILAGGYDPREATIRQAIAAEATLAEARRTLERLDHAERAVRIGQLPKNPTPVQFIDWYEGLGYGAKFPETLTLMIKGRDTTLAAERSGRAEDSAMEEAIHPRQRGTFLKVLLAALYDGYGYRPNARTNSVSQLVSGTERIGQPVSKQTINALLNEAIHVYGLPDDGEPN